MTSSAKNQKHPSQQQLSKFLNGELSAANQSAVEKHLEECDHCISRLGEVESDTLGERLLDIGTAFLQPPEGSSNEDAISRLRNHERYELIERIGAGGMGDVFRARQRSMDRPVAIKVLKQELFQNDRAVARFHNEVKVAARLNHPNIVHSYDAEVSHGLNILVMELVEGDKLSEVVQHNGPLPCDMVVDIALQLTNALEYAAAEGMIHRDIKPQNIMLMPDGKVKITDFGLAKFVLSENESDDGSLTMEGEVFGTPDYIAPEQIRNSASVDHRSDIYSLGCTLYFVLTGSPPFPNRSVGEKLAGHLEHEPTKLLEIQPDANPTLVAIIERLMSKASEARIQTYPDITAKLSSLHEPSSFNTDPKTHSHPEPTTASTKRRTIIASFVGAIAISSLVFGSIASGWFAQKTPPNTRTGKIKFAIVIPSRHAFHPEIEAITTSINRLDDAELEYIADQVGRVNFSHRRHDATPRRIEVSRTLNDVQASEFDGVIFTGGWKDDSPESTRYAFDPDLNNEAKQFIQLILDDRKPVGSICGGTVVLANAGFLNGRRAANCRYISDEIKENSGAQWTDLPKQDSQATTVSDDLIVTGGNYANSPELIRLMMKLARNSRESIEH